MKENKSVVQGNDRDWTISVVMLGSLNERQYTVL